MNVEIWSDIACPWCFIGKRRFEAALAAFPHRDEVTVTWRSFELEPDAPTVREGDGAAHLAQKYGMSVEQAHAMHRSMTELAAAEGLHYDFDAVQRANTVDAHRLVHLAAAHGRQDAMKERVMRAYFEEGELVSDHATLARLAADVGLPEDEVAETLATDRFLAEVREDERTAASLGISAVPFFVVDRTFGAAGAQSPEVLGSVLEQAWEARSPLSVVAEGDTCGIDGC
jgi:predicted DsbA family dithiol-disulfide isomerase